MRDAAYVYDIGKLAISEKLLATPGSLSAASRAIVEKHCEAGAEILKVDSPLFNAAAALARNHHERYDGLGYPQKRKGDAIPLSARIVCVADVLVALTNKRADRPAMPFGHALDQIKRESGSHFDPAVVEALERVKDRVALLQML